MNRDSLNFLGGPWPKAFFGAMSLQAIVGLICEAYTFAMFQTHLYDKEAANASAATQYKTIPTFLTLFIFGFLYELVLTWDALRLKNTIQIIGLCIANLALLVYTAIQIDQIETAIDDLDTANALSGSYTTSTGTKVTASEALWDEIQGPLIAIPILLAVVTIALSYFSWKLYQAFAWDILKQIGADYRMKKRFLHYQVYIALLKFDFFFFLGFTVQFVVVVGGYGRAEYYATIAAMPLTIVILLSAAYCVRHENKPGSYSIIVLYFGGLAYFIFKLFRIYQHAEQYMPVRKSLTAFAVLAILLIICTIINAFYCINNYGNGLKVHLLKSTQAPEKSDDGSLDMHHLKSTAPTRMTID
ncbi:hypothetical protein BD289DRAFT_459275 [Coniella lustricola]|uniref:Uncharacterized protein n=1 Tax=Coniella lustricola TaxID=2025994 RepID=A0A2T3AFE9_9PEZI|nr:hypothetical protein BD289DRAFT_459275 [Coniella lustricola]